nr:uncharacterized protein LOC113814643 [Penaeus vannamei]
MRMKRANDGSDSDKGSVSSMSTSDAKLPKLELPKYDGDLTQWQSFWDRFTASIDRTDIPVITKFTYLQSVLQGKALSAIRGVTLTVPNYKVACDILKNRFGRPQIIINAHIHALMNISVAPKIRGANYVESLWNLLDQLHWHVRSLESFGINNKQFGVVLTPLVLGRLPQEIRLEWSRESTNHEGDLEWLLTFLQKEISRRERSETFPDVGMGKPERRFVDSEKRRVASASALHTSSEVGSSYCAFCSKKHKSEKCWDILKLPLKEREEKIKAGLCFKCLFVKASVLSVMAIIIFFCVDQRAQEAQKRLWKKVPQVNHVGVTLSKCNVLTKTSCVLQTARVKVFGESGACCEATLLFDTGSDRSYVSSNLVKKVKPKWVSSEPVSYAAFGGSKSPPGKQSNIFDLQLVGLHGAKHLMALEIPKNNSHLNIDILVGLDAYWGFMDPEIKPHQSNGLVAQKSVFGWVLSGSWKVPTISNCESTQMLCIGNVTDSDLREFWDLESVGITQKEAVPSPFTSDPVLKQFCENVKFEEGRYEVGLPWKSDDCKKNLMNNEGIARKRLQGLGLVKESSSSTKVRPVFDASATSYNGTSLNDCLESGPSLNADLVKVLVRFRKWKVALTADITKAFLQICVRPEDRDVHRFLWKCKDSIRMMRFVRVPFGNTSSPFC